MSGNNGSSHRMSQRLANESLLDERWALFRKKILDQIDRNPELYADARLDFHRIEFQVVRGRVMNANVTERCDGMEITDKFRIKEHVPVG